MDGVEFKSILADIESFRTAYAMYRDKQEAKKFLAEFLAGTEHLQKLIKEIFEGYISGNLDPHDRTKLVHLMHILGGDSTNKDVVNIVEVVHCLHTCGENYLDAADDRGVLPEVDKDEMAKLGTSVAALRSALNLAASTRKADAWASTIAADIEKGCKILEGYCQKHYDRAAVRA